MRTAEADAAVARGERPHVLVTITGPTRTLRLAREPLDVVDSDTDETYRYEAGLYSDVDYVDEVDAYGLTGSVALQSVRLLISPAGVDVAGEEEIDCGLMAATVEVALWWEGLTWSQRVPVLQAGRVSKLAPGAEDELSELWIDSAGPAAGTSSVSAERDLGTDHPTLGFTALDGRLWPYVVGICKQVPAYKLGLVDHGSGVKLTLGLCADRLAADVQLADLDFYEDGAAVTLSSPTLAEDTDTTGRYTYVSVSDTGATVDDFDLGTGAYTVDYTAGGVACARRASVAARSAGDVLEWLLDRSGERIDWAAQEPCTRALSDLEMGIVRDEVVGELEVIRRRLVPVLPIIERRSAAGLYYAYVDPIRAEVVADLVFGQHLVDRLGPPTYTDLDDVRNLFVVEYAWDGFRGVYASRVEVGADTLEICRYSQQLWGVQTAETIQCDATWSEHTALRIGVLAATRRALPRRRIGYVAHPSLYWIEAGSVVTLTDARYGIASRRAVVRQTHPTLSPPTMEFEIIPVPPAGRL